MTTVTDHPAAVLAARPVTRRDAMTFYATGSTAASLRAHAANRVVTEALARRSGVTPGEARDQMNDLAAGIDALEAEGLTPGRCYALLGLERFLGPFPDDSWMSPSYCARCHRNHPGPCDCDCHHLSGAADDRWLAALKLYGTGRTAEDLRSADPLVTTGTAFLSGVTGERERERALAVAAAIDSLAEAGLTPEQAYRLAGLDRDLGPYEDNAALSAA